MFSMYWAGTYDVPLSSMDVRWNREGFPNVYVEGVCVTRISCSIHKQGGGQKFHNLALIISKRPRPWGTKKEYELVPIVERCDSYVFLELEYNKSKYLSQPMSRQKNIMWPYLSFLDTLSSSASIYQLPNDEGQHYERFRAQACAQHQPRPLGLLNSNNLEPTFQPCLAAHFINLYNGFSLLPY